MKKVFKYLLIACVGLVAVSCQERELNTRVSNATGWNYFDKKTTNFQAYEGVGNVHPTGMVAIQGGSFTVGEKDEFLTAPRNNETRVCHSCVSTNMKVKCKCILDVYITFIKCEADRSNCSRLCLTTDSLCYLRNFPN